MKSFRFLIFPVSLAILLTGCAGPPRSVLISAQRDPHYSLSRSNAISLALRPNPSREDALLGAALMTELSNEHFNLTTNAGADYVLSYLVENDSTVVVSQHEEVQPAFAPPPQSNRQMSGTDIGGQPYDPGDTYRTRLVSTPLIFADKSIRLYLFTNPQKQPRGFQVAWQGYIGGGTSITAERIPVLVKILMGYFGEDYKGKIDLVKMNGN